MTNRQLYPRISRRHELASLAGERNGIFTASDARKLGIADSALSYHAKTGAIKRLARGVYRFAGFPPSEHEALIAAAAALGKSAIVSHESALKLYGVSDVAPSRLHFTVPRDRRYVGTKASDIEVHTTTQPFVPGDVVQHGGFRATSLARSIVDSARSHTGPEQIMMAIREGLRLGLLTKHDLERQSAPNNVRRLLKAV